MIDTLNRRPKGDRRDPSAQVEHALRMMRIASAILVLLLISAIAVLIHLIESDKDSSITAATYELTSEVRQV